MSRRSKRDEQRIRMAELPRFPAMGAASRLERGIAPSLRRANAALEAQLREYGDSPFLRVIAGELSFCRRELQIVADDVLRWADADAERYEYEYRHPSKED